MRFQKLGNSDLEISAIGFGGNSLTDFFGPVDDKESLETLNKALDVGITFIDSSDSYGKGSNEELLSGLLAERRDDMVLCTKFGNFGGSAKGTPDYVVEACEASLKRLKIDVIDLYYQHRVDPEVPIEDTIGAMSRLVEQGKVRYLGLSEAAASTIRRAHKVHPISALQTEYSLWSRFAEAEILPTCKELGITYVAYSPLGRGFLIGAFASLDELAEDDHRRNLPRVQDENVEHNLALVKTVTDLADAKGVSAAQIALAWTRSNDFDIVPIPGTKRAKHVADNAAAADLDLTAAEKATLNTTFTLDAAQGLRSTQRLLVTVDQGE